MSTVPCVKFQDSLIQKEAIDKQSFVRFQVTNFGEIVYIVTCYWYSSKTKDCQFDNFIITGGTVSCHYDNLLCHQ